MQPAGAVCAEGPTVGNDLKRTKCAQLTIRTATTIALLL
jgi:hypothetical protein